MGIGRKRNHGKINPPKRRERKGCRDEIIEKGRWLRPERRMGRDQKYEKERERAESISYLTEKGKKSRGTLHKGSRDTIKGQTK